MLTQEYLKSVVKYNPENGEFTWLFRFRITNDKNIGDRAETLHKKGYFQVSIKSRTYLAHRLAWFYMTGKWPEKEIDHKDTDKLNNRWSNLREATASENMRNRKVKSDNRTGVKGVCVAPNGKFRVYLQLGTFDTLEEAKRVYDEAALKLHGEFAHKSIKNNI